MTETIERHYQGKPCKRGHVGKRYKSTGACVECMQMHHAAKMAKKAEAKAA